MNRGRRLIAWWSLVLPLLAGMLPASALAQKGYEEPPVLETERVLPKNLVSGQGFTTSPQVLNDGFLNHYAVTADIGNFMVVSTPALVKLAHEIQAIAAMKAVEESDTFAKSMEDTAKKTGQGIKNLFTDPMGAFEGAGQGLERLFDRGREAIAGSGPSQHEDSRFAQVVGFSKAKREVAAKFGVDVYSTNQVLQEHLDRLAQAEYFGGLSLGAALTTVPGVAGLTLTTSGTTRLLGDVIRTTPPSELRLMNRKKLTAMGVDGDTVQLFINNPIFSPLDQTVLVGALENMPKVGDRALAVKVGIQVANPNTAALLARMAALYAGYHRKVGPLARFEPVARILYARSKVGKAILILPADYVIWSPRLAGAIQEIGAAQAGHKTATGGKIWLTGLASPRLKQEMQKRGWQVKENVSKTLLGDEAP